MAYSPVYSVPFIFYTETTPNTQFDVPAGQTAVIRQFSAVQNIGGYFVALLIATGLGGPETQVINGEALGADNSYQLSGRWVVPGGGYMRVGFSTLGSSFNVYVGGYLLPNNVP